jgi:hypothetical protein
MAYGEGWMNGRKEGWMDGRTEKQLDTVMDVETQTRKRKKKQYQEKAIPTVASSLNQQELVDSDYKYYTPVIGNVFTHDVGNEPKIRFCAFQSDHFKLQSLTQTKQKCNAKVKFGWTHK